MLFFIVSENPVKKRTHFRVTFHTPSTSSFDNSDTFFDSLSPRPDEPHTERIVCKCIAFDRKLIGEKRQRTRHTSSLRNANRSTPPNNTPDMSPTAFPTRSKWSHNPDYCPMNCCCFFSSRNRILRSLRQRFPLELKRYVASFN